MAPCRAPQANGVVFCMPGQPQVPRQGLRWVKFEPEALSEPD
jgi:hypothetical protein